MNEQKNSILIVDDDPINCETLTHFLSHDYTLHVQKNGLGCIEMARNMKPDLILLDVIMPDMDGFEIIKQLKEDEETKDIPVIFITGQTDKKGEERCFRLGAADYITKPFSDPVVKMRVKNQIQIINQIRMIHDLSLTDYLTGIGNRRFFNMLLEKEWHRCMRIEQPISFMILDIDHFKKFNDTYGHLSGDVALKLVASLIKQRLSRAADNLARWGGEEFAVILPYTDLNGATKVAEDIRVGIEQMSIKLDTDTEASITVSIGVHSVIPGLKAYSMDNFISDVDKALFQAKKTGRNKLYTVEV